jgi:protein tyrosine kinase modulator
MTHELEEESGQPLDLAHFVSICRRRQLPFLISFFFGWLIVWSASWILPARYTWGTQIRVPNVASDDADPSGRLQIITDRILSSSRLTHIIDELGLYSEDRGRLSPDELAERMRRDIKIDQMHGDERQITSINIYYSAHEPNLARRVNAELTSLFMTEDKSMRLQASENTTRFLGEQLQSAHEKLIEQEQAIRVFKERHPQLGSNLEILNELRYQLQSREDTLKAARQLTPTSAEPKAGNAPSKQSILQEELERLKVQRDELRPRYKDRYPEVRTLTEQIDEKDKALAAVQSEPRKSTASTDGITVAATPLRSESEVENLEREIATLRVKINAYEILLSQGPAIEQQLAELTRGYDQWKANYGELLRKKTDSEMATEQLRRHEGDPLRIIDLSRLPLRPDFPNRIKLCGIGLVLGLVLGTLFAGGTEYFDDRLYSEEGLKKFLPTTAIARIPALMTQEEDKRQRRKLWWTWALTGVVFATILTGSAISLLKS